MQDGLWLEDLTAGDRFRTQEHLLDAEEIVRFAAEFDPQPFHLSEEAATDTFFAGLAASGWHTAAITMRLLVTSGLPLASGVIGAGVDLTWPSPTRPGDVLHVELEVRDVRRSASDPGRGIATVRYDTVNQDGEVRQRSEARLLVFARP